MDTTRRSLSRRDFLRFGAVGATAVATGLVVPFGSSARTATASLLAASRIPTPFTQPFKRQQPLPYRNMVHPVEGPYKLFEVTEQQSTAQILPGVTTPVWAYNGAVPGQYVEVDQGEKVKLRVRNALPAKHPQFGHDFTTSTHLHGSASLPQFDGYASDITKPDEYKDYWYPNWQNARTLWFHDHGVHHTAENAYGGLAAQYLMHDPVERNLLPQGEYDVPLTVTDAQFAADGSLSYDDHTRSGLWGDVILVNGVAWPRMDVKQRVYRFRALCAGISRSYSFRFVVSKTVTGGPAVGTNIPAYIVATDGGLTPKPIPVQSWRHAGAERYEYLLDLRKLPPGVQIEMRNASNANNIDYTSTNKVMRLDVVGGYDAATDPAPGTNTIPGTLYDHEVMSSNLTLANGTKVTSSTPASTTLRVERNDAANEWRINQADLARRRVERVHAHPGQPQGGRGPGLAAGEPGRWLVPPAAHPPRRLPGPVPDRRARQGPPARGRPQGRRLRRRGGDREGGGEVPAQPRRPRLRRRHQLRQPHGRNLGGRYMVHCHNLPHEDHDMMVQFAVGDLDEQPPGRGREAAAGHRARTTTASPPSRDVTTPLTSDRRQAAPADDPVRARPAPRP